MLLLLLLSLTQLLVDWHEYSVELPSQADMLNWRLDLGHNINDKCTIQGFEVLVESSFEMRQTDNWQRAFE